MRSRHRERVQHTEAVLGAQGSSEDTRSDGSRLAPLLPSHISPNGRARSAAGRAEVRARRRLFRAVARGAAERADTGGAEPGATRCPASPSSSSSRPRKRRPPAAGPARTGGRSGAGAARLLPGREDGGGGRGGRGGVGVGPQRAAGHGAGGARHGAAPGGSGLGAVRGGRAALGTGSRHLRSLRRSSRRCAGSRAAVPPSTA